MKHIIYLSIFCFSLSLTAQNNDALIKHYEAYYQQMQMQGDVQGIINAMTHLNILKPSEARKDTLAYIYLQNNKFSQALNTIGIDNNDSDSDIAIEVKAVALKNLGEFERAIPFYTKIYNKTKNALVAYEIAELNLNINNLTQAKAYVNLGITGIKEKQGKTYYETQQPYTVPLKAAFNYLDALVKYNQDKAANIDLAIKKLDEALALAPNFNMASLAKNALTQQKTAKTTTETKE